MLTTASPIFQRCGFLVAILYLGCFLPAAASLPVTFIDGNFQILLPDGWSSTAGHPYKLANGDESKVVLITPDPMSAPSSMDQPGQDLKMAQASGPGFVSSYGHLTISGTDFIVYDKQQLDPNHKGILYQRGYYAEGNGYGVTILTQTLNGALPQNDAEIMGLINSFSFVGGPQSAASSTTSSATSTPAPTSSSAAPGGFGMLVVGGVVVIAVVLVVLALIGFFVWRKRGAGPR
jgi:hypothetical protein